MKIEVVFGDITQLDVDAIVNAANATLLGGGGVDGAIHRAAGPGLLEECEKLGGCGVGEAKITKGYLLIAKYVIHTVGPVYSEKQNRDNLLYNSYYSALKLAEKNSIQSIAFPNISTGVYRFPKELAAEIAIRAVKEFSLIAKSIENVIFCCHDAENYVIYKKILMETKD